VERFLAAKKIDPAADTSAIDHGIDERVFDTEGDL
jgi:hypothetical protein